MVATLTKTDRPTIVDAAHADQARRQLAALDRKLAELDSQHATVSAELGDALADAAFGNKKAGDKRAGQLSMKRVGIEAERRDAQLTANAVRDALAVWDAEDGARRGQEALRDLAAITGQARDLEERFAAALIVAAELGRDLGDVGRQWQGAYRVASPHGDTTPYLPAPRSPHFAGLRDDLIDDPRGTVARWQREPK